MMGRALAAAVLTAALAAAPAVAGHKGRQVLATQIHVCEAHAATLILIDEQVLTRTRITAATAAGYATPVELRPGDHRLASLNAMLRTLPMAPGHIAEFDPRTFITLTCADGHTLAIEAAATQPDGLVHMRIGTALATTDGPLRHGLATMLATAG